MAQKGTPERMGRVVLNIKPEYAFINVKIWELWHILCNFNTKYTIKMLHMKNKGISIQIVNNMVQC